MLLWALVRAMQLRPHNRNRCQDPEFAVTFTGRFILHSHIRICSETHVLPCAESPLFHLFKSTELCCKSKSVQNQKGKPVGSVIFKVRWPLDNLTKSCMFQVMWSAMNETCRIYSWCKYYARPLFNSPIVVNRQLLHDIDVYLFQISCFVRCVLRSLVYRCGLQCIHQRLTTDELGALHGLKMDARYSTCNERRNTNHS